MKITPFTHFHEALGARMAPFAGYNMPIEYSTGIKEEHLTVRNKLGVFDVSHMGEFGEFSGVGIKTSLGMGCIKIMEERGKI